MRKNKQRLICGSIYRAYCDGVIRQAKVIREDSSGCSWPFLVDFDGWEQWCDQYGKSMVDGYYITTRKAAKICLKKLTNSFNLREFTKIT